jgi:polysaccharide chain length determinant protein (PEP-CTERM system associated)
MLPGKKYKPEDLITVAWRQRWLILVPFLAVSTGTVVVSRQIPDRYRSEALMVVVPQRVPESYVRSTVTSRVEDRLNALRQTVLSRTQLETVIRDLNLYPDLKPTVSMEEAVRHMRADVLIDVVRGDSFRIAYTAVDPRTAQRVAERLASQFNEENLRDRASLADATTEFLGSQLDEARRRLVQHEQKLADYKLRHAGELPSERNANLQVLNNVQLQVQALVESISRDRDRRMFLERSLADLEAEAQTYVSPSVPPAADPTALAGAPAATQLENARNQLQAMELRLKPEHPDVIRMKKIVRDLEAKVQAEELKRPLSPTEGLASSPEEAARQNRIRETKAELQSLESEIASKEAEERRLRGVMGGYQTRLAAIPSRESELTALTRDYDTLQRTYESLLAREQDAKIAANLERRQIGEQFRIVDMPRVPEHPFSPNRLAINLIGALVGLGLGLGLAALLEYQDTSFRSDVDVVSSLSLPVLAVVPVMLSEAERRDLRRRTILLSCVVATLLLIFVGGAAVAYRLGALRNLL